MPNRSTLYNNLVESLQQRDKIPTFTRSLVSDSSPQYTAPDTHPFSQSTSSARQTKENFPFWMALREEHHLELRRRRRWARREWTQTYSESRILGFCPAPGSARGLLRAAVWCSSSLPSGYKDWQTCHPAPYPADLGSVVNGDVDYFSGSSMAVVWLLSAVKSELCLCGLRRPRAWKGTHTLSVCVT